jgi:hypothetical protein
MDDFPSFRNSEEFLSPDDADDILKEAIDPRASMARIATGVDETTQKLKT